MLATAVVAAVIASTVPEQLLAAYTATVIDAAITAGYLIGLGERRRGDSSAGTQTSRPWPLTRACLFSEPGKPPCTPPGVKCQASNAR